METIQQELGFTCDHGPREDLDLRARELEVSMLGRSEEILLPQDFPARLILPLAN